MSESVVATIDRPAEFRLCLVSDGKAYFTDAKSFNELRTEDWENRYGMGLVLGTETEAEIKTVLFTGPVRESNNSLSPRMINEKELVWLGSTRSADEIISVHAKTSLSETIELVNRAGGTVYIPVE